MTNNLPIVETLREMARQSVAEMTDDKDYMAATKVESMPEWRAADIITEMAEALCEVAHHADDECGFMVQVRAAIAKART